MYNKVPVHLEVLENRTKIYINNSKIVVDTTNMKEIYKAIDLFLLRNTNLWSWK